MAVSKTKVKIATQKDIDNFIALIEEKGFFKGRKSTKAELVEIGKVIKEHKAKMTLEQKLISQLFSLYYRLQVSLHEIRNILDEFEKKKKNGKRPNAV